MAISSLISTTNPQTPNNTSTSKSIKSIPYMLSRTIHTIMIDKNLKKLQPKELHTTLHQRGYPTTLMNKVLELAEKIPQRELRNPKKHNNEKTLAYIATYNKNNPELFTEIMKNLKEIENNDKIKEILDTAKIIKSQRQPKNVKRILTSFVFGENTTQGVTKCKSKQCKICDIIIEGKSFTFKNLETKLKLRLKKVSLHM